MARFSFRNTFQRQRFPLSPTEFAHKGKRVRLITLGIYLSSLSLQLAFVPAAHAAGGAHVVDDANVETAGKCHLESWVTRNDSNAGLVNLTNACVTSSLPTLEFGATVQRQRALDDDNNRAYTTVFGPLFKWNLRSSDTGVGVALAGNTNWSTQYSRWEDAALSVPVTIPLNDAITFNLNYGLSYARDNSEHRIAQTYGAQIEAVIAHNVSLMAEVFQRQHSLTGAQAGVRFTPDNGPVDIDVLYGRRLDGTTPRAITVGLTLRY